MASSRGIRAGRAYVETLVDNSKFESGLRNAERRLASFGAVLVGISAALLAPFALSVDAASNMEETMNKFNVVFGSAAEEMKRKSDEMADALGRSEQQMANFLSETQDLLVPLGFAGDEASHLSETVSQLAVDLASFNNMADADTLRDLKAALTGSGEVMKKYGVVLTEAAVKQELLNMGMSSTAATNQEKVMARLNIILRGTTAAQGDAERSGGSYANMKKRLTGEVENLRAALGTGLLPLLADWMGIVSGVVQSVTDWASANQELLRGLFVLVSIVGGFGGGLLVVAGVLRTVTFLVNVYRKAVQAAAIVQAFLTSLAGPKGWAIVAGAIVATTVTIAALNDELEKVEDTAKGTQDAVAEIGKSAEKIASPLERLQGIMRGQLDRANKQRELLQGLESDSEKLTRSLKELRDLFHSDTGIFGNTPLDQLPKFEKRLLDQQTGIFTRIQDVRDEIALLNKDVTKTDLIVRDMLAKGVPQEAVDQLRTLLELREKLKKDQETEKERDKQFEEKLKAGFDLTQSLQTPLEAFRSEAARIKGLRDVISPETFQRAMAAARDTLREGLIGQIQEASQKLQKQELPVLQGTDVRSQEGFARIFRAVTSSRSEDTPETRKLQSLIDQNKKLLSQLEAIEKNTGQKPKLVN